MNIEKKNWGVMQGRLSPIKGGRIQSFPWQNWQAEFKSIEQLGLTKLEWTLDLWRFYKNPIIRNPRMVNEISKAYNVDIISVTSDAHMHGNFWIDKRFKIERNRLDKLTRKTLAGMKICEVKYLVVPLVDESSLESASAIENLKKYFLNLVPELEKSGVNVLFEADFSPTKFRLFIEKFPKSNFGINYDIGNSAALGFDPDEEFEQYGRFVKNVHVKDRPFRGENCALGTGNAEFNKVIHNLKKYNYSGDFVMQTARSKTGEHISILRNQLEFWEHQWEC